MSSIARLSCARYEKREERRLLFLLVMDERAPQGAQLAQTDMQIVWSDPTNCAAATHPDGLPIARVDTRVDTDETPQAETNQQVEGDADHDEGVDDDAWAHEEVTEAPPCDAPVSTADPQALDDSASVEDLEDPQDPGVLERAGAWEALADRLRDLSIDANDEAEKTALLARRARVLGDHVDVLLGVEAWHDVLRVRPDHQAAMRAIVEGSRALEDEGGVGDAVQVLLDRGGRLLDQEEARTLTAELVEIRARQGAWDPVLDLLVRLLDLTDEPGERRLIVRRLAAILTEAFDDADQAFELLVDALRDGLDDERLVRDVEKLARWTGRFTDLVRVTSAWLSEEAACSDARRKVDALLLLARWYGDELEEPRYALDCLEQAAVLGSWEVRPRLLLAKAQEANGRRDDARATLEEALARAIGIPHRRDAANALAELLERGGDTTGAAKSFARARDLDGDDLRAHRGLARVLPKNSSWAELETALAKIVEGSDDDHERAGALVQWADVREQHFLDPEGAAQKLERALELDAANDASYIALARCFRKLRLWDAAAHVHERQIDLTTDDRARVDAYFALGRLCEIELGVVDRAIEAYRAAIEIDGEHLAALESLARIYERHGEWTRALSLLRKVVDRTENARAKTELLVRIAAAYEERLGDREVARVTYERALEHDPRCLAALGALRRIAQDDGDDETLALILDREQRHTPSSKARARLLVELARLRRDHLGDAKGALHAFEEAHRLDPEQEEAARAIVEVCLEQADFAGAEPILAKLTRDLAKKSRLDKAELLGLHGRALAAIGKPQRAAEVFRKALEAVPTDPTALEGLAEATWVIADYAATLVAHQKLLRTLGEDPAPLAKALYRVAIAHRQLGDPQRALRSFERVLEVDSDHRRTLEALVEMHESRGAHREALQLRERIADLEEDSEARCRLLSNIAEAWLERTSDAPRAVEALEEALRIRPDDRRLLHRLLPLQEASEDWQGVCDTIRRIVALDDDGKRCAKYLHTVGNISQEQLGDPEEALAAYEGALDRDPTHLESFEQIDRILTRHKSWVALDESYRRMIARADARDEKLLFTLWHGLGCLRRDRLGDPRASSEAFRVASRLRPDDSHERQILAQVYQATDRTDLAIAELHQAIDREPLGPAPYRSLYALYARTGMLDRACCVAGALRYLGVAEAEHLGCLAELVKAGVPSFRAPMSEELWRRSVVHPLRDAYVGEIFAVAAPTARAIRDAAMRAQGSLPPSLGLAEDPQQTRLPAALVTLGLSRVLGIEAPRIHVRPDFVGTVGFVRGIPDATVVGGALLSGCSVAELAFVVGKHLAQRKGELGVRADLPSLSELTTLLCAAITVGGESPTSLELASTARALGDSMDAGARASIRAVVLRARESGVKLDPQRWLQGAELTAVRAAFILSGDLRVAGKVLRAEVLTPGDLPASEKMKELLRYSVSRAYFDVRRALGIAVAEKPTAQTQADDDDEPTKERRLCA